MVVPENVVIELIVMTEGLFICEVVLENGVVICAG